MENKETAKKDEVKRIVISKSAKRKQGYFTEMVVYKSKGKSTTKHERVKLFG